MKHIFFATNGLGGGGTNVSRFVVYFDIINLKNVGLLLNYYYLNTDIPKGTAFDQDILKEITQYSDINKFLEKVSEHFINKGRRVPLDQQSKIWSPKSILDSGIGNILRDMVVNNEYTHEKISELINDYHVFAENVSFEYVVALDYALKYTHKKGETESLDYKKFSSEIAAYEELNLDLLETTLGFRKTNRMKQKILAPIHGYDYNSYISNLNQILEIEMKVGVKFDGFAIGGIANTRSLDSDTWKVPAHFNKTQKSGFINASLTNEIKQFLLEKDDERWIHILGSGNIFNIPFITMFGGDSSDCHSAWRRASDGSREGTSRSKYLIPLLDSNLEFFNNRNLLKYIKIDEVSNIKCECSVCSEYNIEELKKLYFSNDNECHYYSKILLYIHSLNQYERIIEFSQKPDYISLLTKTPDNEFNTKCEELINTLLG